MELTLEAMVWQAVEGVKIRGREQLSEEVPEVCMTSVGNLFY